MYIIFNYKYVIYEFNLWNRKMVNDELNNIPC